MPWSFIVPAAISLFTSNEQSNAAQEAASTAGASNDRATALQQRMYEEGVARQQPYYQAGTNALAQMQAQYNNMPAAFTGEVNLNQDPGYAFRLKEGQQALDRQAAARGGLISGGALKAAQRYGQEMGSQEYTNAFNRYQTERQARLNPLQSLAGMAQTSVGQLGQAGQAMATGVGEAGGQAAQARASGYMGGANALSQGLNQYLNYSQGQERNALLSRAIGGGGGGYNVGTEPYAGYNASIGLS